MNWPSGQHRLLTPILRFRLILRLIGLCVLRRRIQILLNQKTPNPGLRLPASAGRFLDSLVPSTFLGGHDAFECSRRITSSPPKSPSRAGRARKPKAEHQLLRQVATCLLFEDTFYEKGSTIASEIAQTCKEVSPETIGRRGNPGAGGLQATSRSTVPARPA